MLSDDINASLNKSLLTKEVENARKSIGVSEDGD